MAGLQKVLRNIAGQIHEGEQFCLPSGKPAIVLSGHFPRQIVMIQCDPRSSGSSASRRSMSDGPY